MRNAILFVLVLTTGCGASVDVLGCLGGWFEFTCNYKNNGNNKFSVCTPRGKLENKNSKSSSDTWILDKKTSQYWYRNTTSKYVRVFVQQLTDNKFGEYECKDEETEIKLQQGDHCPQTSNLTANRGAKFTINCTVSCTEAEVNFICKKNTFTCDTLSSGSIYTISRVSEEDRGVYVCGCQSSDPVYRVSKKEIKLHESEESAQSSTPPPKSNTKNHFTIPPYHNITPTRSPHSTDAWIIIVTVMVVCVIILLLTLAFCFHKKWCFFAKPTAALKEEHYYDEIQERPQQLSSGTALKTIYTTATLDNVQPGPGSTGHSTDAEFKENVLYVQC